MMIPGEGMVERAKSADPRYLGKLPIGGDREQLADWYAKTSPSYSSLVSRPGIVFAMKFSRPSSNRSW